MEHYYQTLEGENWFNYEDFYSYVIDNLQSGSNMVEVGSWIGRSIVYFAVESIRKNKDIKCYCVDIWSPYSEIPTHKLFENDEIYKTFLSNTENVRKNVEPIRKTSSLASEQFENESLDFVFIDAAHDLDNVLLDINLWLPKVKKTGIIGGHDYYLGNDVFKAVNTIFPKNIIEINGPCWFVSLKNMYK
jgi:predicted O-methyltransferase YrrM